MSNHWPKTVATRKTNIWNLPAVGIMYPQEPCTRQGSTKKFEVENYNPPAPVFVGYEMKEGLNNWFTMNGIRNCNNYIMTHSLKRMSNWWPIMTKQYISSGFFCSIAWIPTMTSDPTCWLWYHLRFCILWSMQRFSFFVILFMC